jgi:dimethylargininase
MSTTALVRRPSSRLTDGIVSHIERVPVDVGLAMQQWEGYVSALHSAGWDVVEVPPADDCPDSVFVEDTVVVFRGAALVTRPGAEPRRPETAATAEVVASFGYEMHHVAAPGTLDGGDVLKVGDTIYVRLGGRTNDDGLAQLRAAFMPHGARVVAVPVTKVLHLKSAVTALPDGSIIGWPDAVDDPDAFPLFRPVPEESGSHVVLLGDGRLLMADDAPRSAELFVSLGYTPVPVPMSEFAKLEGCVTCLSVRLRDIPSP